MADLDAARIAAAALRVADEKGVTGFTMRAVAEVLGVTPMALYHHVDDKAALAVLVVDLVISERPLPARTGVWEDDLWEIARWTRATTLAHPHVAYLRRQYQVWTPTMLAMAERWLSIWQQSGLPLDRAILAANTSSMAIFGAIEQEAISRERTPPSDEMLGRRPAARAVLTAERDASFEFEFLARSVIDGVHTRVSSREPARPRDRRH